MEVPVIPSPETLEIRLTKQLGVQRPTSLEQMEVQVEQLQVQQEQLQGEQLQVQLQEELQVEQAQGEQQVVRE